MEDQIISFETAKLARQKGIDQGLICSYIYCIGFKSIRADRTPIYVTRRHSVQGQFHLALAPTQSLLRKYLREKHNLHIIIKDGDKTNNDHSNLEWVTNAENQKHKYKKLAKKVL